MRLGSQRFGEVSSKHGKSIIIGRVVIPKIVGVMNGANRFSFILFLKGVGFLVEYGFYLGEG